MTIDDTASVHGPAVTHAAVDGRYLRRLGLRLVVAMTLLMGTMATATYFFHAELGHLSRVLVQVTGDYAIAAGFFVADGFTFPVPPDAFLAIGAMAGLPFWTVVFWASVGSVLGGCAAWGVGRLFRHTRAFKRFMDRHGREVDELLLRFGTWALAIAALTPVPYSICCYACSAAGMPLGRFVLVSLLRVPRVAIWLWLIQLGFVSPEVI